MENFPVWSCDEDGSIFILNLAFQKLNIAWDLHGEKVVYNLRLSIKSSY